MIDTMLEHKTLQTGGEGPERSRRGASHGSSTTVETYIYVYVYLF